MSRIVGSSFPAEEFCNRTVAGDTLGDNFVGVLHGKSPVIAVPGFLTVQQSTDLSNAFYANPSTEARSDGVKGQVLGAYHYGKSFHEYMSKVQSTVRDVNDFLAVAGDPVRRLLHSLERVLLSRGVTVRPARWRAQEAAIARALSWPIEESFMLDPHDDVGQLTNPIQAGFEAQKVASRVVVAVNLYPHVPAGGGKLRIWNIIPNLESRMRCGTTHTGYPYDPQDLQDYSYIDIEVASGMAILMNGGLVHAVTGYDGRGQDADVGRLLINFFVGLSDDETLVHWV